MEYLTTMKIYIVAGDIYGHDSTAALEAEYPNVFALSILANEKGLE